MSVRGEAAASRRAAAYRRAERLLQTMAGLVERHEEVPPALAQELDEILAELRALRPTSREGSP